MIDIRMDLRQFQITRSLNNRMGTGHGSRNFAFFLGITSVNWQQLTIGSTASGTLSVGNGTPGSTANITLLGNYLAANFNIQSDGQGGTAVTDPPVLAATEQNPIAPVNTLH